MDNNNKQRNLLAYINTPMSKESIMMMYDAHNVRFEKCELYNDFVQSLLRLAFDTYMGDEVTDVDQQTNHFDWCWKKVIDNFSKEGITFKLLGEHRDYLKEFMDDVFYNQENEKIIENLSDFFKALFDEDTSFTKSDLNMITEIYKLFEKSYL